MALTRRVAESTGVPAGVYVAELVKLEEDDGQYGAQIKFYFEMKTVISSNDPEASEWLGEEKWGWCSDRLTPNTKLFHWYKQLMGVEPDIDDDLDLTEMLGKQAVVTIRENKNGNMAITDLAAYSPQKKKRKAKAEPEPDDEFEGEIVDDDDEDDEIEEDFD